MCDENACTGTLFTLSSSSTCVANPKSRQACSGVIAAYAESIAQFLYDGCGVEFVWWRSIGVCLTENEYGADEY